jgi:SAM-dependent methyltransferase
LPAAGAGTIVCQRCSFHYEYDKNYLKYEYDSILFETYKDKYLLNKVLNNNAYLSYIFLPDGSLSLAERDDVKNFRSYIQAYLSSGIILDVGCGIMPVPGYLDFEDKSNFEFYGLDPIDDKSFSGVRIVGCAEFMPFEDTQFNAIVLATTLDHVCSLERSIDECNRVLYSGGRLFVWMSDRSHLPTNRLKRWWEYKQINKLKGYRSDKFFVYSNWTVLHVPEGAVDPFHSFNEDPQKIVSLLKAQGFQHNDMVYNNPNEVFLCFTKVR